MKNTTLLLLLITQGLISQIKYVESDTDSYIDFTNKKVNLTYKVKFNPNTVYKEYSIEGNYTKVDGKYGFIIADGGENVWIISHQSDVGINGIDILKGDYKTILKEFKKKRKYKKSILLFSNLPSEKIMDGYNLVSKREIEKKELSMKFDSEI